MEQPVANGYVLTVALLIAAYVRHYDDEEYKKQSAETSILMPDSGEPLERKTIAKDSVSALAQFLLHELQHPLDALAESGSDGAPTSLSSLFQRLHVALSHPEDATILMDEVLQVLASVDSPDAVSDIVDAIGECVAPLTRTAAGETVEPVGDAANALLVRKSVFGVFIRRFVLAVNRLLFDGLSRVYDEITNYREEFADQSAASRRGANAAPSDISISLTASPTSRFLWKHGDDVDDLPLSPIVDASTDSKSFTALNLQVDRDAQQLSETTNSTTLSKNQSQFYLHDVMRELERGLSISSTTPPVDGVLRPLRRAMDPDALFVMYLDAVNRRDYDTARELLHNYHDVSLSRTLSFRHALRARNRAVTTTEGATPNTTATSGLHFVGSGVQYAALNLAGLHLAFERLDAAQDSIQEAIRVAQHHGDHVCVAFALHWLVRVQVMQGKPRQDIAALVASALERAEELSLQSLRALASLTSLEYGLLAGESSSMRGTSANSTATSAVAVVNFPAPRPLDLWSRLNEVEHIIVDLAESMSSASAVGGNTGRTLGNLMNMQQQQQQLQSGVSAGAKSDGKKTSGVKWKASVESVLDSVWALQGKSRAAAAIGWQLFGLRALSSAYDNLYWEAYKHSVSAAEIALWISRVVFAEVEWGSFADASGSDNQVMYARALLLLRDLVDQPELHGHELLVREKVLQRTIQHILALWSVGRGEYTLADAHIAQLVTLSPSAADFPSRVEALVLQAQLLGESEQYTKCFALLDELEAVCDERGIEFVLVQVLILKSEYMRRSRLPHSPFDALPSILRAIQICQKNRYDLLLAEAHLVVAETYIATGRHQDAVDLLDRQMPLVLENGSIRLRAESLLLLAKATLAGYNDLPPGQTPLRGEAQIVDWLDDSAELYRLLDALKKLREIAFLKTTVLHRVSRTDEATAAANDCIHYQSLLQSDHQAQFVSVPVTAVESTAMLDRIVRTRTRSAQTS